MFDLFAGVTAAINSVTKVLRLRKPGLVFLCLVNENNSMLEFKLLLPPASAADVASREVRFMIDDFLVEADLNKEDQETNLYQAEEGAVIRGTLVDIDDAGNRSEAREFEYTLNDTLAPPQPGELGLEVVAEFDTTTPPPVE